MALQKNWVIKKALNQLSDKFFEAIENVNGNFNIEKLDRYFIDLQEEMLKLRQDVIGKIPSLTVTETLILKKIVLMELKIVAVRRNVDNYTNKEREEMERSEFFYHIHELEKIRKEVFNDDNDYWQLILAELIEQVKKVEQIYVDEIKENLSEAITVQSYPYAKLLCGNILRLQKIRQVIDENRFTLQVAKVYR